MRVPRLVVVGAAAASAALIAACGGSTTASPHTSSAVTTSAPVSSAAPSTAATAAGAAAEEGKTATQVLADARRDLAATSAVHVTGTAADDGQTLTFDLHLQGKDLSGTLTEAGQPLQLVVLDGVDYLRASAAFWTANAGAAAGRLGGHWIVLPASEQGMFSDFTLQGFDAGLNASDSPLKPKPTTTSRGGQRVIVLTQQSGDQAFLTDSGAPLPIELIDHGSDGDDVRFADYGTAVSITKPAGAESAAQAALGGSST